MMNRLAEALGMDLQIAQMSRGMLLDSTLLPSASL
jgi:hypothetical protein